MGRTNSTFVSLISFTGTTRPGWWKKLPPLHTFLQHTQNFSTTVNFPQPVTGIRSHPTLAEISHRMQTMAKDVTISDLVHRQQLGYSALQADLDTVWIQNAAQKSINSAEGAL